MSTSSPASRQEFGDYCLRRLGYPVVNIEISPEQVQDRINDALQKYYDYHYDATEHCYYKIRITQTDITNQYFTIPDDFIGITRIFRIGNAPNISNLFNIRYQIHLNDLFDYSAASFTPYVMAMRHIETLEEIFVGEVPIRYQRHNNRLYCDFDWNKDATIDGWIVAEGYRKIDPDVYTSIWDDMWLKRYATALIKQQWGMNITKYTNWQLVGGNQFDGTRILKDAETEIEKLEAELISSYSLPVTDMVG